MTETHQLTSVWEGGDKELLHEIIPFYLKREPTLVIDVTWGSGKWWADSPWFVTGMDIETDAPFKGDYREPWVFFPDACADVVVFDPPHRSQGGPNRSRLLEKKFSSAGTRPDALISHFPPVFSEAMRVLKPESVLLVKVADQVQWHKMVWHQVAAVNAAVEAGLTPCDMIIKVRTHGIKSSKWRNSYHALKRHAFWLVFRNTTKCEPSK